MTIKHIILFLLLLISSDSYAQKEYSEFKKREFRLNLGLPYLNHLFQKPNNVISINKAGFIGESIGIGYSYNDKQFIEFKFSLVGVADNPLPFPIDQEGEYQTQYSTYFSFTNNHIKNRLIIGYGLNYSINTWAEGFRSIETPDLNTRNQISNKTVGVNINCYYRIGKSFNVGAIYRPSYFRQKESLQNKYEHLISIEFLWRIR